MYEERSHFSQEKVPLYKILTYGVGKYNLKKITYKAGWSGIQEGLSSLR